MVRRFPLRTPSFCLLRFRPLHFNYSDPLTPPLFGENDTAA